MCSTRVNLDKVKEPETAALTYCGRAFTEFPKLWDDSAPCMGTYLKAINALENIPWKPFRVPTAVVRLFVLK